MSACCLASSFSSTFGAFSPNSARTARDTEALTLAGSRRPIPSCELSQPLDDVAYAPSAIERLVDHLEAVAERLQVGRLESVNSSMTSGR